MAGWFELSKSSDNQFRFVLKAGNGETILTSELYTSKASAEKGIASVRSNSPQEERYEKKTASNGKFYFNLKAANHQIIGSRCTPPRNLVKPELPPLKPMAQARR